MKKINLTILAFMTIIFLSSCNFSSSEISEEKAQVQESGETKLKGTETQSISTGFTNK